MKLKFEVLDRAVLDAMTLDELLAYQKTAFKHRRDAISSGLLVEIDTALYDIQEAAMSKIGEHESINKDDFSDPKRFVEIFQQGIGQDTGLIQLSDEGKSLEISVDFYDVGDCLYVKGCFDEEPCVKLTLNRMVASLNELELSDISGIESITYCYTDKDETCHVTPVTVKGLVHQDLHRAVECLKFVEMRIEGQSTWAESTAQKDELVCYEEYEHWRKQEMLSANL